MIFNNSIAKNIFNIVRQGKNTALTEEEFYTLELQRWLISPERMMQIKGHLYYEGEHDILYRKREMITGDGETEEVKGVPNNHVIDNQYAKLVNQKANYLVGQPFVIDCQNDTYVKLLKGIFDKQFMRTLKNTVKNSENCGIAWLYPYYADDGKLSFRLFPGYEILPFWQDSEHTVLDSALRYYLVEGYEGSNRVIIQKVEIYDRKGVHRYTYDGGKLTPDVDNFEKSADTSQIVMVGADGKVIGYNWERIPLVPIKFNEHEIPLIKKVKSLQDGINAILSDFENNMQEDKYNTIYVLKNYDGTDLGEFRKNLAVFGAVKVRCDGDMNGGVETLEINVNSDNYKAILEVFKKALIENGMGYDAKDDRLSGNPNQMNIQSMYSDIDLDANDMETELQASFVDVLWFVNAYLANAGYGDFSNEEVNIIFNRDILINETEAIANCVASVGLLSTETIIKQHPWIDDPLKELELLEEEKKKQQADMYDTSVFQNFREPGNEGKKGGVDDAEDTEE